MRTLAFVERLLRRWRRGVASLRPLGLVFRRPSAAPRFESSLAVTYAGGRVVFDVRPRLELTLVRQPAEDLRPAASPGETVMREASDRLVLRRATATAVERLVERVLVRGTRVESAALARQCTMMSTPSAPRPGPRPSELVVRREAVSPPAAIAPAPAALAQAGAFVPSPTQRPLPTELATPLDVEALTDRVVASIDRRIVVESERTGRA